MAKDKKPKRHWNYRVMAFDNPVNDEIFFEIREMHYENKKPTAYSSTAARVGGESLADFNFVLKFMKAALKKRIIWAGDKFPKRYKGSLKKR